MCSDIKLINIAKTSMIGVALGDAAGLSYERKGNKIMIDNSLFYTWQRKIAGIYSQNSCKINNS